MPETLLDYLTRKNPDIIPIEEPCKTQTINRSYLRPYSIHKWSDISLDTVKAMYADILVLQAVPLGQGFLQALGMFPVAMYSCLKLPASC